MRNPVGIRFVRGVLIAWLTACAAAQAVPVTDIGMVAAEGRAAPVVTEPFSLAAESEVYVSLTDFGTPGSGVLPAAGIWAALVDEEGNVAWSASAGGRSSVNLSPGNWRALLAASPDGDFASIGFSVKPVTGGGPVLDLVEAFSVRPRVTNPTAIEFSFTAPDDGPYELAVGDPAFPAPLSNLQAIAIVGGQVAATLEGPGVLEIDLSSGDTVFFTLIAERLSDASRSLLSWRLVRPVDGAIFVDELLRLGDFAQVREKPLGDLDDAANYGLVLTDFMFPSALTNLRSIVLSGTTVLRSASDGAGMTTFSGGDDVIMLVAAGSGSSGTLGVRLTGPAGEIVDEDILALTPPEDETFAAVIEERVEVTEAGQLTLTVNDFEFPGPLESVAAVIVRDGSVVTSLSEAGQVKFDADAGAYLLTVVGNSGATDAEGMLGATVADSDGLPLAEATAVAGRDILARPVSNNGSQRLRVTLTDLRFPERFASLSAIVARGATLYGTLLGGGSFDLDPGVADYTLSLIAEPGAQTGYSGYLARVFELPDPPSVMLAAGSTTVVPGGTVTLTWSATDADRCSASGAWSGDKGTSGSESITGINAVSTFELECTGLGGSGSASVTVHVRQPSSSGGGSVGAGLLVLLLLAGRRRQAPARVG